MLNRDLSRCSWVDVSIDVQRDYHDNEWCVPVYDDNKLFEMLILESYQAGLSWLTVLKKREAFRSAFDNFDPIKISTYSDDKIQELLKNENIIRSELKIKSTITNSKAFLEIQREFASFSNYLWGFTNNKIIKMKGELTPTKTELSDKISKDMKKRGMKFLGSVTVYSYLQAIGVINCHETNCFKY